jgi:hypothetical protein
VKLVVIDYSERMKRTAIERLRRFVAHRPDLRYFVGEPHELPIAWAEARVVDGALHDASGPIDVKRVRAYAIVYANGEMVWAELGSLRAPAGTRYLESEGPMDGRRVTGDQLAADGRLLQVRHGPSPIFDDAEHHTTSLSNLSRETIIIESFSPASVERNAGRVVTVTLGRRYDREQFASWYGAPGGRIEPGATVRDPANWGQPDTMWVYVGVTASGEPVIAGAAR